MSIRFALLSIVVMTATGCATKGPLNFRLENGYHLDQTAVIRPATEQEKTEPMANLAVRIFVNPAGRGSVAHLVSIAEVGASSASADLDGYDSVRVKSGAYRVGASCMLYPWTGYFSVYVEARQGKEYLLECLGNTAHTMHLKVMEHG